MVDGNFSNQIFFSNFTLGGYVKKQNCCIWGSEHYWMNWKESITFWKSHCLVLSSVRRSGLLWSYACYWRTRLGDMWFQQGDATCHTTLANLALLKETFPGSVISRRGGINWPPRSLTPLYFFFVELRKRPCLYRYTFNFWALNNQHSSSYNWVTAQYVSKSDRKLPQKKWCSIPHIMSTFKLYNQKELSLKKIFHMCLI